MTKTILAASTAGLAAMLVSSVASAQAQIVAQGDSPQWLKDRSYNEGAGVRVGDLELHPGIAGEAGYDSNWFYRAPDSGFANGPPNLPVVPAMRFRITPSLYLSTLGPQRRGEDAVPVAPSVAFRAGVNATYNEFVGLSNTSPPPGLPAGQANPNDISQQRNIGGSADMRLDILPEKPLGADLVASYLRVLQPNIATADPNLAYNRDEVNVGGDINLQPGSGTLDYHLGYAFHDVIYENSSGQAFDNILNEVRLSGRWKFQPKTALVYAASLGFMSYVNSSQALTAEALVNSTPVRTKIGLNGLITDRLALTALVGWGASFYDNPAGFGAQPQYDSVIGTAELKWYLAAGPGVAAPTDVGLALSSLALGYNRDFVNSLIGNYYGIDRGYLKFSYFFAGRALVSIEGGLAAIEYPNILWGTNTPGAAAGSLRQAAFTDTRPDVTVFGEYRFTDAFAINATVRYTANFSNVDLASVPGGAQNTQLDMAWSRVEAYLGLRYFL
jgi:hypothetical protein